jgi:hypothetical protein
MIACELLVLVLQRDANVEFMKKDKTVVADELRPEYKREDFKTMVRGKYAARLKAASNVVVLTPEVAEVFPNAEAVNEALMGLIDLANTLSTRRSIRNRSKTGRVG